MKDAIGSYLKKIGKTPLLTAEEEIKLGTVIREYQDSDEPTPELKKRAKAAKQKMVNGNLRLVVAQAKKYKQLVGPDELLDLVQSGNLGLIRAVELFDPKRGYKFSTYSTWWIFQGLMSYISEHSRTIRLPTSQIDNLKKMTRLRDSVRNNENREVTTEEICRHCNITHEHLNWLIICSKTTKSLDEKAIEDGSSLIDLVPDKRINIEDEQALRLEQAMQEIDHLDSDISTVLKMIYIEGNSELLTAQLLNKSRREVRRLRKFGIKALKDVINPKSRLSLGFEEPKAQLNLF